MIVAAHHILELLAEKHSKDVFVPECKDGPTQSVSNYSRMDAWVMNRSWARPCYTAYEIKVYRSDFLSDKKWRYYLPYCNEFYFVAPKGMIRPDELPPEAGLMEQLGGPQGRRLIRRKNAPWRDVEVPESLFRYVLMARVKVGRSEYLIEQTKDERAEEWRQFIAEKVALRKLGHEVAKAIREKAQHLESENERLAKRMDTYDDIRELCQRLSIDPDEYVSAWTVEQRIKEQQKVFEPRLLVAMRSLQSSLSHALDKADKLEAIKLAPNGEDTEAIALNQ